MLLELCACAEISFYGSLHFTLIIFMYLSTVSFATGNIKLLFSWGEEVDITLPYQIYSSYLRDYIANYIWNIKVFPNVMKNLVVYLLWKISLIHLIYKSQSLSEKVGGQNDTITAAIFAFSLICACAEFICKYALTWKYVNMNF